MCGIFYILILTVHLCGSCFFTYIVCSFFLRDIVFVVIYEIHFSTVFTYVLVAQSIFVTCRLKRFNSSPSSKMDDSSSVAAIMMCKTEFHIGFPEIIIGTFINLEVDMHSRLFCDVDPKYVGYIQSLVCKHVQSLVCMHIQSLVCEHIQSLVCKHIQSLVCMYAYTVTCM